ncbi:hypothetical protein GCM10029978_035180 [Actinoallomurus acanthiterrae]
MTAPTATVRTTAPPATSHGQIRERRSGPGGIPCHGGGGAGKGGTGADGGPGYGADGGPGYGTDGGPGYGADGGPESGLAQPLADRSPRSVGGHDSIHSSRSRAECANGTHPTATDGQSLRALLGWTRFGSPSIFG